MKICYIADARSPIAQNWIRHFVSKGDEVHVVSSYLCVPDVLPGASIEIVPVAFSRVKSGTGQEAPVSAEVSLTEALTNLSRPFLFAVRHWFGPLDVLRQADKVREIVRRIDPDLVHAMRIPFEGMLAAEALREVDIPLLISVWGNDFTLHARQSPLTSWMTRRAMRGADALHPDCHRDLRLAASWGFDEEKPAVVLPGGGGVQRDRFHRRSADRSSLARQWHIPESAPVIINPRGFRPAYVRNDTLFRAIPIVLSQRPDAVFLGLALKGNSLAEKCVDHLGLRRAVQLLPPVTRDEVADLFRLADISVSPSEHDGTPNTLLEALACGAFPVAGDIESVREWIVHGKNGLLCDPADPQSLAKAIIEAIQNDKLREQAARINQRVIDKHADYEKVMTKAAQFYRDVAHGVASRRQGGGPPSDLIEGRV